MKKTWQQRWMPMLWNTLRNAIPRAAGLFTSVIIIRFASFEVWGDYARHLIVIHFGITFSNWGSRLFLMRTFSDQPQRWQELWLTNIKARIPLLIIPIVALGMLAPAYDVFASLLIWIVCLFGVNAFEPVIVFHHRYTLGILNDLVGTIVFIGISLWPSEIQYKHLIWSAGIAASCRLLILLIAWRGTISLWFSIKTRWDDLKQSWVLAMQNISGLLVSKMDTYSVAALLPSAELGAYHVIMNAFGFMQALPEFAISTQLKNLYRLQIGRIQRMGLQSFFIGCFLTFVGIICLKVILWFTNDTHVSIMALIAGFLFVLPMYVYLPYVHALLKEHKSMTVLRLSLMGAMINLIGNILFIPSFEITGAVLSAALTQWILLGAYILEAKIKNRSDYSVSSVSISEGNVV